MPKSGRNQFNNVRYDRDQREEAETAEMYLLTFDIDGRPAKEFGRQIHQVIIDKKLAHELRELVVSRLASRPPPTIRKDRPCKKPTPAAETKMKRTANAK